MKLIIPFTFLAVLAITVKAWTKEDHEIFDLVSALEGAEGKGTTFYSWLDVPSTATTNEIAKAYRKKSMMLHPDKNPGVKGIHDRFARLGVVSTILRNKEARKRYDFFYKNGVPKWRGTGYYYSRFRPGLGSVLVFLVLITSSLQLLVQRMNYKRDVKRVENIMNDARAAAWGPKLTPIEGKRKVKVNLGGGRRLDDNGNIVDGKLIDMVVEGENVYILDPTGDLELLDTSAAVQPTIKNTWFISTVTALLQRVVCRSPSSDVPLEVERTDSESEEISAASGACTPVEKDDGVVKGRAAAVKAGGKRRKTVRKGR